MGELSIAERIEQAKKTAQNLKAEIEVRARHPPAGSADPVDRSISRATHPLHLISMYSTNTHTHTHHVQEARAKKDDASFPEAARGQNLPSLSDKGLKVRRILKVRRPKHDDACYDTRSN